MRKKNAQITDFKAIKQALVDAYEREPVIVQGSWNILGLSSFSPPPNTMAFRESADIEDDLSVGREVYVETMRKLLSAYYVAIEKGNADKLKEVLERGFPVNYIDPITGLTALHLIAGTFARKALKVLLEWEGVDFLIRDKQGRLASEYAMVYSDDAEMALMIMEKENEQGEKMGLKVTHRPLK